MMKVARGNAPGIYLFDGNTSDQIINGACYIHCFAVFCNYNLIRLVEGSLQSSEKPDFPEPAMVSNVPFE